ncbi:MAG TPA: hypothetical protein VG939_19675, partial [Caulobacteraceae bacterium]|nr:hypothetical protein [Caulobacteraceae bacterium]
VGEAFRAPAEDPAAEAVAAFHATLDAAAATGVAHADAARPHGDSWWRVLATPLFDAEGRLAFLLAETEEAASEAAA